MIENTIKSRKEKAADTKNKIYNSAEHLFSQHGFDAVNVDQIVKHAGVAKGSFYVHFETKEALIALLINDYVKRVDTDYKAYLDTLPDDMPIGDIFLSLIGKIADIIAQEIGYVNIKNLYKAHITQDVKTQVLMDYNRELYLIFNEIVSRGMNEQAFQSELSVEEIAKHFVVAFRGLTFEWCIRFPDFELKEQALIHFKMLLTGISAK